MDATDAFDGGFLSCGRALASALGDKDGGAFAAWLESSYKKSMLQSGGIYSAKNNFGGFVAIFRKAVIVTEGLVLSCEIATPYHFKLAHLDF
jgi:hypothetical protein